MSQLALLLIRDDEAGYIEYFENNGYDDLLIEEKYNITPIMHMFSMSNYDTIKYVLYNALIHSALDILKIKHLIFV
jgi:hypothetical protein